LVEEGPGAFRDPSIRPNALMALTIDPELFTHWQAVAIVERVRERLLTPIGLRTLEQRHPDYRGDFRGPMNQRQAAYHQGTCWVFLLGFYARAALALEPNDFELQIELRHTIERLMDAGPLLGQLAQVASGDPPHHLGGCPAQAWSVAELARTLHDLGD
jgi:glycogen debranching enzyme